MPVIPADANCAYAISTAQSVCLECNLGFTLVSGKCFRGQSCAVAIPKCNYCTSSNSARCEECESGYIPSTRAPACLIDTDACTQHSTKIANCKTCVPQQYAKCKECNDGYVPSADLTRCVACAPGCKSCELSAEGTKCTKCVDSQILDTREGSPTLNHCIGACDGLLIKTEGDECTWKFCHIIAHCAACTLADEFKCESCAEGFALNQKQTQCISMAACQIGETAIAGCSECDSTKPEICKTCQTGYRPKQSAENASVPSCVKCPDDCASCVAAEDGNVTVSSCSSCTSGFYLKALNDSKIYTCDSCKGPLDQISSNGLSCMKAGCASIPNCTACSAYAQTMCISCEGSLRPTSDGAHCVAPTYCLEADPMYLISSHCATCNPDYPDTCAQCKDGYVVDFGSNKCLSCIPNCKKCSLDTHFASCEECDAGFYLDKRTGSPSLNTCVVCATTGTINKVEGSTCVYAACASVAGCQMCNLLPGSDHTCLMCSPSLKVDSTGLACIVSTACLDNGPYRIAGCTSCANTPDICATCGVGTVLASNGKSCIPCLPGCVTCTAETATQSCSVCTAGLYLSGSATIGALNSCVPCTGPLQKISADKCVSQSCASISNCISCQASDEAKCAVCAAGMRPSADNSSCIGELTCLASTAGCTSCSVSNPTVCNSCKSGYVLSKTNTCEKCIANCQLCENDATRTTTCTACAPGYYIDAKTGSSTLGTCVACTANLELAASTICVWRTCKSIAGCTACQQDQTKCLACEAGKIVNVAGTACIVPSACTVDPALKVANCVSCNSDNQEKCSECKTGFVLDPINNVCVACMADCLSCSLSTVSTKCLLCADGFFVSRLTGTDAVGKCVLCKGTFEKQSDGKCEWKTCRTINGCQQCKENADNQCAVCSSGMLPSASGLECVSTNACKNQGSFWVPYCTSCDQMSPAVCLECATGYVLDTINNICVRCLSGCVKCDIDTVNTKCDRCGDDSILSKTGACVTSCIGDLLKIVDAPNGGKMCTDKSCASVDHCLECNLETEALCSKCSSFYDVAEDGASCVPTNCTSGSLTVTNCVQCSEVNAGVCTKCSSGRAVSGDGRQCGNLSSGGVAGIAVAIVVVVLAIVGILVFFAVRECKKKSVA